MKTLNGLDIKHSFLSQINEQEGAIEIVTACGKHYRSVKTYSVVTDADLFGLEAAADCFSHGSGEVDANDFYFHRNSYGSEAWTQKDENELARY